MNNYKKLNIAACIVAITLVATCPFGRAENVTAQENLEKLKKTNNCRGCDLSGLDLNRLNLAGADLEGADCSKAKFHLTNLSGANLRGANLRGASFGGADLGEADLRGADLRGTSLEGAYLDKVRLDGEFITAKPYEELGVTDVEKQVYVPNPEKPKKSPETRDAKVATHHSEEPSPATAATQKVKSSSEEKAPATTAMKDQQPSAPIAKKAIPVGQAIVEPQEAAKQTKADQVVASGAAIVKSENAEAGSGKTSLPSEAVPKKMAVSAKASPVPPTEVKLDEGQAVASRDQVKAVGGAGEANNPVVDKSKSDRLSRLVKEEKCLGCDLSGLDLSGKNLKSVDLEKANLTGCNLERVILDKANLKGAILQHASLRMASLKNADLYKADLTGADLSGANVQGAKLDSAKLATAVGMETTIK